MCKKIKVVIIFMMRRGLMARASWSEVKRATSTNTVCALPRARKPKFSADSPVLGATVFSRRHRAGSAASTFAASLTAKTEY